MKKELQEMVEVGAHFGYTKTRRHPSVKSFIFNTKNKIDIIDLEKTEVQIEEAIKFIEELAKDNKKILFVGTKPEASEIIKSTAVSLSMPYVVSRWIGGTITNFSEIKRRVDLLVDLKDKKEKGLLEKYTKKEQSDFSRKILKMSGYFGGLVGMDKKPDALFIIDSKKEHIAFTEALKMKIPVIAIASTDSDISEITYPVVANDTAVSSLTYLTKRISQNYKPTK